MKKTKLLALGLSVAMTASPCWPDAAALETAPTGTTAPENSGAPAAEGVSMSVLWPVSPRPWTLL